jgi:hypothetical protein
MPRSEIALIKGVQVLLAGGVSYVPAARCLLTRTTFLLVPDNAGHCDRWMPGPTAARNGREERGQRAKQSETGVVPYTMNTYFLSRSVRGVSCLPGARPGGCATWNVVQLQTESRGATVARSLRVRPSRSPAPHLIDES